MKFRRTASTTILTALTVIFVLAATAGFVQPLAANETVETGNFKDCRAIKGKSERLLCYDTIADGGVFNQQQLEQVQRETFGNKQRAPDVSIDQLSVTIVKIQKDVSGLRYFITADGQAWKQQDRGSYSSKVPFEAEIKSGTMGSFFMVNESGRGIRVKRVK